jgi:para-nitrobenzyl esterase
MTRLILCAILLSVTAVVAAAQSDPVVKVTGGTIRGRVLADDVASFKGIPFAAPPIGDLRWREPQPVKPWKDMKDATGFSASCMQEAREDNANPTGYSEDCLYLNVWAPKRLSNPKLPVMFYLYGGGNLTGSAAAPRLDGAALSRHGVVVVTINYRLGLFGYFVHPELTAESPHRASGNYGLMDQVAALKWVHANIARFGGDPGNVTVFGQSAGGWNTGLMVETPLSKGLLRRGIMESGPGNPMASLEVAEKRGAAFASSIKAPASGQVAFLRALPADQLQKAAVSAAKDSAPNMGPSVDGWVMPLAQPDWMAKGREQHIPLIIGSNAQEMAGPEPTGLHAAVTAAFGINADKAMAFYGLTDGGPGNVDPLYGPVGKQVAADGRQRCGSVQDAIWHAQTGSPTWEYQWDRPIPGRPATQHGAEVGYLFGTLFEGGDAVPATSADRKAAEEIQAYWLNFAKSGDPNGGGMPLWPKFNPAARGYMEFTTDNGPIAKQGLRREVCDLYLDNVRHQMGEER